MIDHLSIGVSNFARSLAFYDSILAELGFKRCFAVNMPDKQIASYGSSPQKPIFWLYHTPGQTNDVTPPTSSHIAFSAPSRSAVDGFYQAAIAAGGRDNGQPGLRTQYHPNYYATFVIDPDGYRVEAVCHQP
jgi:catechol 2,3-dioxygenase-like lactoylglutathione lyase family enzyme